MWQQPTVPNLNRLLVFHAVAEAESFTRAADLLCLTQPGVSKHVKQLEEHFGTKLFDRLGKRVVLTQPGKALYEATREVVRVIRDAEARIAEVEGPAEPAGQLNVAACLMTGTYVLPPILAGFQARYARIELRVDLVGEDEAVQRVLGNAVDLGVVCDAVHDARLFVRPFLADELVAIVPPDHPWAGRRTVSLPQLLDHVFLLPRLGSGTRSFIEQRLSKHGVRPARAMEYGNTEALIRGVSAGLGVAVVSRRAADREIAIGHVASIRLSGGSWRRDFSAIWRREKYLSKAARAFIQMLAQPSAATAVTKPTKPKS